jgi:hypothetical protein
MTPVNILNQIIPGIRETRTPFTVGLLWALTTWVACSLLPAHVWHKAVFHQAGTQLGKLPAEVLIGLAALLIYIFGILMQGIGSGISRLGWPVLMIAYALYIAYLLVDVLLRLTIAAMMVASVLLLCASALRYRRVRPSSFWDSVEASATSAVIPMTRRFHRLVTFYREAIESHRALFEELSHEDLEAYYASHPAFLGEKIHELDQPVLYEAALRAGLTLPEIAAEQDSATGGIPGAAKSLSDLRLHRHQHDREDGDIRRALITKLNRSREAREAFAAVLDLSAQRDSLHRRLEQADHQLRSTCQELYAEYDRVRAEGEFRTGIAFPVAALIAAVAAKWHAEFNTGHGHGPFYTLIGVAALAWIVIGFGGSRQTGAAKRMLYAAIRDKTITVADDQHVGEPIFVYKPLPDISRPALLRHAVRTRTRRMARRPLEWILPELRPNTQPLPEPAEPPN